jgi:hypothetical protein
MPLVHCSLRSLRLALRAAAFLPCLQTETFCSLLLSPAARGPGLDCFAPLSADRAMESADFVVPRRRKTCLLTPPQHGGARSGVGLLRSVNCSLRSLRLALRGRCLPHSLADEKACLLARSSRTAARQPCPARIAHGGARSRVGLLRPIRRGAGEESDCRDVDLGTRNTFGAPL